FTGCLSCPARNVPAGIYTIPEISTGGLGRVHSIAPIAIAASAATPPPIPNHRPRLDFLGVASPPAPAQSIAVGGSVAAPVGPECEPVSVPPHPPPPNCAFIPPIPTPKLCGRAADSFAEQRPPRSRPAGGAPAFSIAAVSTGTLRI